MRFQIVTDSSSNLTDELIDQYQLHIIPLMFRVDGEEYYSYLKGEKSDLQRFYTMLREGKVIVTSLATSQDCERIMEPILQNGEDLLYIGFSSALSGTYQVAEMTAEQLRQKYPDRKIYTVDTRAASLGEGLLVTYAARMRAEGASIEEVYNWLLTNRFHLCHWFTVDDLSYLKRGGRISGTTAFLGTMLKIKPVLHMDDEGRLIPIKKVQGRRASLNALLKKMQELCLDPKDQTVYISHGDCIEDALYVRDRVQALFSPREILINYVDPVIGAHSGPGTVALFFMGRHR